MIHMKLLFISLGCDKNRVDSEYMLGMLGDDFEMTDDESEADIIIINTCCFIHDAKEESIETILEMAEYRKRGSCRALIVCGCLAQRYQSEIRKEIPEVDAILGTNATLLICDAVRQVLSGGSCEILPDLNTIELHDKKRLVSTGGYYAYLKIAEGCDKHCTYCIIPSIRGPYRSVPMDRLIAEARQLAADGVRELILVAQETTVYGTDLAGRKLLPELLDRLNEIEGIEWIRLMYCYPEEIDEALIDAILRNSKVCHYLDMPIQHINSAILKRMGRQTDREELESKIALLRERIPDIALRTSLICGFPGETAEQHEELMYFLNETEFDRLGAFTYSQEEDTPAAAFPDQIPEEIKTAWQEEVMELQEEIIMDRNEELIGQTMRVMIEGRVEDGSAYAARSYRDAPDVDGYVFFESDRDWMSGDFAEVRITGFSDYDLIGELL